MYSIVVTPNSVLTNKAREVKKFDKKLHQIIEDMKETLKATEDPVGVGLAAPQVGLPIRLFLARPKENGDITVFINPVIESMEEAEQTSTKPKKSKKRLLEGCLSIPNIWGHVTRKKSLTLAWQDEHGKSHQKKFTGFLATIIQHELDHLDGILFTKHVMSQREKLYRSYKNDQGKDEFEEIKI